MIGSLRRVGPLLGALVAGCSVERAAPTPAASFAAVLDTLVPAALGRAGAPGAVVAVVEAGTVQVAKGYGMADRVGGRAMTDSTIIAVASVSKLVSSWGLMSLVAKGLLPLDGPIDGIAKTWTLPRSAFDRRGVTVRSLWSHTAGLNLPSVPCFPADSARPNVVQVLSGTAGRLGPVSQVAAPGSGWSYSGGGYTLLQLAATEVSGKPFADLMRAAVLEPLGMRDSYFGAPRASSAIQYDEAGKAVRPMQCVGDAASGLNTSARDMAKLLREYGRARRGESTILPAAWLDSLAQPVIAISMVADGKPMDLGDSRMGLGHFVHDGRGGRRMLFHSGGNLGVVAYVLVDLDRDGGLFIAVNADVANAAAVVGSVLAAWAQRNRTDPPTLF